LGGESKGIAALDQLSAAMFPSQNLFKVTGQNSGCKKTPQ